MAGAIELKESPVRDVSSQGTITYSLDTADYGGTPTSTSVIATNLTTGVVVTSLILTGSTSVSSDTITWPAAAGFQKNNTYALDCLFTCNGNDYLRRLRVIVGNI